MAKNSCNLKASRTLDVHEETIRALYKTLELVGSGLLFGGGVQKIDRHIGCWWGGEAELNINPVKERVGGEGTELW
jgi:hypothetical protein